MTTKPTRPSGRATLAAEPVFRDLTQRGAILFIIAAILFALFAIYGQTVQKQQQEEAAVVGQAVVDSFDDWTLDQMVLDEVTITGFAQARMACSATG